MDDKKEYYVYIHYDMNNIPFYVGKGKGKRAYSKSQRNEDWKKIASNGYNVDIIKDNLTNVESMSLEVETIKIYGRLDRGTGTLVNRTSGGGGSNGYKATKETCEKLSKVLMGKNKGKKPNLGRKFSDESKKKMSEAKIGMSSPMCGKKHSDETKKKISEIVSRVQVGRKHSEETKEKMRKTAIERETYKNFNK